METIDRVAKVDGSSGNDRMKVAPRGEEGHNNRGSPFLKLSVAVLIDVYFVKEGVPEIAHHLALSELI